MIGVFGSERSGTSISEFLCSSNFDNAFVVGDQNTLLGEISHYKWRRMLARGVDDDFPLAHLLSLYRLANAGGIEFPKQCSQFPWIKAEFHGEDAHATRIVRTTPVFPSVKPVSAVGLIMAGGFGRRLGDITLKTPKPMLDLGGKPVAGHLLDKLIGSGITDVYMSVHYMPQVVKRYFGDGSGFGARMRYLEEDVPLGTAGCLSLLPRDLDKPIVMVNGDVVTGAQFGRLLEFHLNAQHDITVSVRPLPTEVQFGVVEQVDGLVTRIREKPRFMHQINVAIYALSPKVLAQIPPGERLDMPTLIGNLIPRGFSVGVFPLVENWIDIGTVADLNLARAEYDAVSSNDPPEPPSSNRASDVPAMEAYRATA